MSKQRSRVIIRADGSNVIGMGHVYRALNLAFTLDSWADVTFLTRGDDIAVKKLSECFPTALTRDADEEYVRIAESVPDVVIVDKLNTDEDYMRKLKSLSRVLVSFDDCGEGASHADIAFNVLYHCKKTKKSQTRFLNEPKYAIINPNFSKVRRRETEGSINVLVTLGGADTLGLTPRVIEALCPLRDEFTITVVVGPAFKHFPELEKAVEGCNKKIDVRFNVPDLWNFMSESNIAVSAGGNTLFELAASGTPAIALCEELFEVETAERMMKEGTCVSLGYAKSFDGVQLREAVHELLRDREKRREMGERGLELVDGEGPARASQIIRETLQKASK